AAAMLRKDMEDKRISFSNALPDEELAIRGDHQLLRQVLVNLISNAVKFTLEEGAIAITVDAPDDASIEIAVTDNGIGIAKEDISRVMKPFEQVETSLARLHGGVGLGLPLTKKMIEAHGGRLTLTSAVGVGTTATVWLPREPAGRELAVAAAPWRMQHTAEQSVA
nr:ATP-binding protein [Alphaproteobacteria bacterium]